MLWNVKVDESWDLFERLIPKEEEEKVKLNFVTIGKKNCKIVWWSFSSHNGVPLVINTFGRILLSKTKESLVVY